MLNREMRLRLLDAVLLRRDADADDDDEGADAPADSEGELAIVMAWRACERERKKSSAQGVVFLIFFYAMVS